MKKPQKPVVRKSELAFNRKATFDTSIDHTLVAGLVLTGDEIKSIRAGRVQLTGGYVKLLSGEPYVVGMHLSLAAVPDRSRKLLLKASEIAQLAKELQTKGRVAVPVKVFLQHGWAKLSVGVGSGRKRYDKRELLKKRDIDREQRGELKRRITP